ncbi:hypothetical protein NDU88_005006 [Pleurodeles waltl]|uniref:Uncharacterized protein n=1 Tax=Pleurodeles waltl TaxID=8319 RepID=A0AAV7LB93_PLEWA|nr:hypothetical protein NDU88_005006 [Pleurodeles waltl]
MENSTGFVTVKTESEGLLTNMSSMDFQETEGTDNSIGCETLKNELISEDEMEQSSCYKMNLEENNRVADSTEDGSFDEDRAFNHEKYPNKKGRNDECVNVNYLLFYNQS